MSNLWVSFIILGLVQGFSEVLPISSSAHVTLASRLFSIDISNLALSAGLHIGSLIAIIFWFRRDIYILWHGFRDSWHGIGAWLRQKGPSPMVQPSEQSMPYFMALSLVPIALEGIILKPWAENVFKSPYWTSALLIINGLLILATARWTRGERTLSELEWWEYLLIGALQGFAVLPGISRLGLTLCLGLACRLNWYEALRLTFLYAVPVLTGAILWQTPDLAQTLTNAAGLAPGFIVSLGVVFIASLLGLRFLMASMLERRTLVFFGQYCCMAGLFTFVYFGVWR